MEKYIEPLRSLYDSISKMQEQYVKLERESEKIELSKNINKSIEKYNKIVDLLKKLKSLQDELSNKIDEDERYKISKEILEIENNIKVEFSSLNITYENQTTYNNSSTASNIEPPVRAKVNKDSSASRNFTENKLDLDKYISKVINDLQLMVGDYDSIESMYDKEKSRIVRLKGLAEERHNEIEHIKRSSSLSDGEKLDKIKKIRSEGLDSEEINKLVDLSDKERESYIEEKLSEIDVNIYRDKKNCKAKIEKKINDELRRFEIRYKNGKYSYEELYNGLKRLCNIELENIEMQEFVRKTFDEQLMRFNSLYSLYIGKSEIEAINKSNDELIDEEDKTIDSEDIDFDDPNLGMIYRKIDQLLNEAEQDLDLEKLGKARELIGLLKDGKPKDIFTTRADEIEKLIMEKNKDKDIVDDEPKMPKNKIPAPETTWKAIASLAAGIGLGATVVFGLPALGVGATATTIVSGIVITGGGLLKRTVNKKIREFEINRANGIQTVNSIEEPSPGIKGQIEKIKAHFNNEATLRNLRFFLNGAIYSTIGFNLINNIVKLVPKNTPEVQTNNVKQVSENFNSNTPEYSTDTQSFNDELTVGRNVSDLNLTTGNDTAFNAGINNDESLISSIMNDGHSIIGGESVNSNGEKVFNIIDEITNKSRAWVTEEQLTSELVNKAGGMKL